MEYRVKLTDQYIMVEETEKVEYLTKDEISDKKLKLSIPKKWSKLGITSVLFDILMKNKVFATTIEELIEQEELQQPPLAQPKFEPAAILISRGIFSIIRSISVIAFVISTIMIVNAKIKSKKQKESIKISKKIKIVCITSVILFFISWIAIIIIKIIINM